MPRKKYTDAEKAAYYRKKAREASAASKSSTRRTTTRKTYKKRQPRKSTYTNGAIGEMVGGGIGAAIGGGPGALIGGAIGRGAHKVIKALTGFGDYRVEGNTLMCGGMSPPMMVNSVNRGGTIVRHREYLKDVLSTTDFTLQSFDINPGLSSSFPWLSGVSENYEEYALRGLVYEFKSLSSDAVLSTAASSALGAVIMATSYNVLNPNFPDKASMENYEFANSSKPSLTFYHPIECKRKLTPVDELYTRVGPIPSNADQRLYDLGKFQIATVGMQVDGGVIGELWCTYEVELYKPKLGEEDTLLADGFDFTGTISGSAPMGTGQIEHPGSNLGGHISRDGGLYYYFPNGLQIGDQFLVSYVNIGAATVTYAVPAFSPSSDMDIVNFYSGGGYSTLYAPATGETSKAISVTFVVQVVSLDSGDIYIEIGDGGTLPNGTEVCSLTVSVLPDKLLPNPSPKPKSTVPTRRVKTITTTSIEELDDN